MKPAIIVLSHPNNFQKEYLLKDFGNFISQYNIPHYLFTNYPIEKNIQQEFVGAYYHNFNPTGPFVGTIWKNFLDLKLQHNQIIPNWCFSGTHLLLHGFKHLKGLGYTHAIFLAYDIEPDFNKVKEFIKFSLHSFESSKKGVFAEYPEALTSKNGIPQYENIIDTIQCACEVNFFIDIFEQGLQEYGYNCPLYQENPGYLCEHFWEYVLRPYKNDINIIPRDKALRGIYSSANSTKLNGTIPYYVGYDSSTNNVKFIIESLEVLDIELTTQNYNLIPFTKNIVDNFILLELDLKLGDECNISYIYNNIKHTINLFNYTEEWIKKFYFKKI